ncbi:MAG TPA: hypothetical protein VGL28_08830 [Steroidobacteraceae bacterium]
MLNLDVRYIALGSLYLVLGMIMGLVMGIRQDFTFVPVHAHINLVGFTAHCLFGLVYRAWPRLQQGALARLQFWLFVPGTPLLLVGIGVAIKTNNPVLAATGSLLLILGALVFLLLVWSNLVRRSNTP